MINSKHVQATEIVASLEGMRVLIADGHCELHEYDFERNQWREINSHPYPLTREQAEIWLTGWNTADRLSALSRLTAR